MLKLSNRGLYGIKALYELARRHGENPIAIREISERHGLPVPFLEQVLNRLKRAGIVESRRGTNGGYVLSRTPAEITLGDAVRALEGPIALCDCLQHEEESAGPKRAVGCVTSEIYRRLGREVERAFDSITLQDLAATEPEDVTLGKC
ncbi:MAG: RrF2 family transcriptional regulator [Candidatus Latescibacterota bacterium]